MNYLFIKSHVQVYYSLLKKRNVIGPHWNLLSDEIRDPTKQHDSVSLNSQPIQINKRAMRP